MKFGRKVHIIRAALRENVSCRSWVKEPQKFKIWVVKPAVLPVSQRLVDTYDFFWLQF